LQWKVTVSEKWRVFVFICAETSQRGRVLEVSKQLKVQKITQIDT